MLNTSLLTPLQAMIRVVLINLKLAIDLKIATLRFDLFFSLLVHCFLFLFIVDCYLLFLMLMLLFNSEAAYGGNDRRESLTKVESTLSQQAKSLGV